MSSQSITYLRSLEAVRERSHQVLECARNGQCNAFLLDEVQLDAVVDRILALIRRDYPSGPQSIPPHSRWRHFEMDKCDRVQRLLDGWSKSDIPELERVRRVFDLFLVAVLLDAGAGDSWKFVEADSPFDQPKTYARSEGLAVASLAIFKSGCFSSESSCPHRVDTIGLQTLTVDKLAKAFQVSDTNPLVGLEGRCQLLVKLGKVIEGLDMFHHPTDKNAPARPGYLVDNLAGLNESARFQGLWDAVYSLTPIWPSRTILSGVPLGDVWSCACLKNVEPPAPLVSCDPTLVPFHKLSQWMTYSLCEPLERLLHWKLHGKSVMTGLAEYRNGGLLVDAGVLSLKEDALKRGLAAAEQTGDSSGQVPLFKPDDQVIVEWRALTVALLDVIAVRVRQSLNMSEADLELAKVLEAGTWKAGREIAAEKRPKTKAPPLNLISDGTVF